MAFLEDNLEFVNETNEEDEELRFISDILLISFINPFISCSFLTNKSLFNSINFKTLCR